MKIVIMSVWFSEKMGYIENCLPKFLARQGHEVHVVTSCAQVYYNHPNYESIYSKFLGNRIAAPGTTTVDGYTLHRLPFGVVLGKIYLKNLHGKLKEINPDVVHSLDSPTLTTLQSAALKFFFHYHLFSSAENVLSVFPFLKKGSREIKKRVLFTLGRRLFGRLCSFFVTSFFAFTIDAGELAVEFYGIPKRKIRLLTLGTDSDYFNAEYLKEYRHSIRLKHGFTDSDMICIYTGRFTDDKQPLCLAKAIGLLRKQNESFKAIFIGDGPLASEISKYSGCVVHPFVHFTELAGYYHAAEMGIWPSQESTSMIDAAACGLPVIISDKVRATERMEGNGLTYPEGDVEKLANTILQLKDSALRNQLSIKGIEKGQRQNSWKHLAADLVDQYVSSLKKIN